MNGWEKGSLESLTKVFTDGNWIESKDQSDGGIRLIQTGNIGLGEFRDKEERSRYIDSSTFSRLRCTEIFSGDVLISRLPDPVGRACLMPDIQTRAITAVDCTICRFNDDRIIPKFFLLYSQSNEYLKDLDSQCTGATRRRISRKNLGQIQIPVPPLSEQKRIVEILDEAFDGIAKTTASAQRNLANAHELFVQQLHGVFTGCATDCVKKKISEIAQHSLGKMLDKSKNRGDFQPYLRNLNVRWFDFDLSDILEMKFLPEEREKYTAIKGDVLVCEGGYPGRAAIWTEDNPIYFQKALHRVRFYDPAHAKWFVYYLFAQDQNNELKKHFNGAGIQHFTGKALAKFAIPVPQPEKLSKFVSVFDASRVETQRLEAIYNNKLATLSELKQSLLHKAFTGQLTGKEDIAA